MAYGNDPYYRKRRPVPWGTGRRERSVCKDTLGESLLCKDGGAATTIPDRGAGTTLGKLPDVSVNHQAGSFIELLAVFLCRIGCHIRSHSLDFTQLPARPQSIIWRSRDSSTGSYPINYPSRDIAL